MQCSVSGCARDASAFLRLAIPLDGGAVEPLIIDIPIFFCVVHREDAHRKDAVTDEIWKQIQELIPPGHTGDRSAIEVMTAEVVAPPQNIPPEIDEAIGRFMRAVTLFGRMGGGGQVRANAGLDAAQKAAACARALRNYPGAGDVPRHDAADAFDDLEAAIRAVSKLLFRNQNANEDLAALDGMLYKCRQLTAAAMLATVTNPNAA